MPDLDLLVTLLIAAFIHGMLGFGFPLVATPVLALFMDLRAAVLLTLVPTVSINLAVSLGMDVLVEVHDRAELDRALQTDAPLIGINNRNLRSFETSLDVTLGFLELIPEERLVVTESGIHTVDDVSLMRSRGVNAFLVGEAFMKAPEPGEKLRELFFQNY